MNDGLLLREKISVSVPPCDRISTYMYILNTIHCLSLTPLQLAIIERWSPIGSKMYCHYNTLVHQKMSFIQMVKSSTVCHHTPLPCPSPFVPIASQSPVSLSRLPYPSLPAVSPTASPPLSATFSSPTFYSPLLPLPSSPPLPSLTGE